LSRKGRSKTVFFRYEGASRVDVYFRINPTAIRFQQEQKASLTATAGGYYYETFFCKDPQYNGLQLGDLTIEGETGIAHRKELKQIDWIWRHHGDRKPDNSPADIYFFDFTENGSFQDIERDAPRAYLIAITNFGWDDTAEDPYRIRFVFRAKVLRDLFWELSAAAPGSPSAKKQGALQNAITSAKYPTSVTGAAGVVSIEDVLSSRSDGNLVFGIPRWSRQCRIVLRIGKFRAIALPPTTA
jgi:hypothetical protein